MEIILSKNAGFCPGVRRADEAVKSLINARAEGDLIFTLGPLIHNGVYVSELDEMGVRAVNISDVQSIIKNNPDRRITFVIRTHGVSLSDEAFLRRIESENPLVTILDMTCPSVKRIHKIATENTSDDTYFILFGSPTHPESVATISYAKGPSAIISSEDELKNIDFQCKVPILCAQTTANLLQFIQIKKFLKKTIYKRDFF